jgi:hypothetical protein
MLEPSQDFGEHLLEPEVMSNTRLCTCLYFFRRFVSTEPCSSGLHFILTSSCTFSYLNGDYRSSILMLDCISLLGSNIIPKLGLSLSGKRIFD